MIKLVSSFALMLATLTSLPFTSALAQNARSWVASTGSGSACTRALPCAGFRDALLVTNDAGEINCVDQGDFSDGGAQLFIQQSVTIDCQDVQGRFQQTYSRVGSSPYAIRVGNGPSNIVVVLRGLDISSDGSPQLGVLFGAGAALHIEKCVIRNFRSAGPFGWGIKAEPQEATASELFVSDTVLENNGNPSGGGGIWIAASDHAVVRVTLNRVETRNNFFGIKADATQATGGLITMLIRDSVASGNASNGIVATGVSNGSAIIMAIEGSTSSQNATAGFGVISDGPTSTITLSNSTIMGNINGIGASNGGSLVSYQNNSIILNSADGSPTSVISPK